MKYIVEADEHVQMISLIAVREGTAIMITGNVETFQTADKALDDAYQKGFEAGQHEATTLEYQQGLEEGKKQAKVQAHLDVCHDIEKVAHGNYQKGLDDAWETIIKIALIPYAERSEIFDGQQDILSIVQKFSPSEVIAKLREYEQQKAGAEIKVGDEVESLCTGNTFIIHEINENCVKGYNFNNRVTCYSEKNNFKKTGRHFPQIKELIEAMKEGAE